MAIQDWSATRWTSAAIGTAVTGLLVAIPTGIVTTNLYQRMTPVPWWNYPVWVATSVLSGLILATYVRSHDDPAPAGDGATRGLIGGTLSFLSVGCPICNKIVIATLGVSGAFNIWAPVQPALGVISVALLTWALARRLRNQRSCVLRPPSPDTAVHDPPGSGRLTP